ncbi:hypothetical protein [Bacillus sp. AFS018417]|nr:hypothetical protein [Bacillus sp. AFS018417]
MYARFVGLAVSVSTNLTVEYAYCVKYGFAFHQKQEHQAVHARTIL